MVKRQGQKADARLCPISVTLIIQAKPRGGRDLPDNQEVARPKGHHAQWLTLPENTERKTPPVDAPVGELAPVIAKDNARSIAWHTVGPGGQERALVRPVDSLCGNLGQGPELLLPRQPELQARRRDDQAE